MRPVEPTPLPALVPLFAALLAACHSTTGTCEGVEPEPYTLTVDLSAQEYEAWKAGNASTSTGESTTDETTTGDATTGGMTTDGMTTTGSDTDPLTDAEICAQVCDLAYGALPESCSIGPGKGEGVVVSCVYLSQCVGGRGHAGVGSRPRVGEGPGAWLARAAHDEAASVCAFEALAVELADRHAPAALVVALRVAAGDERRHAAAVDALARARGAAAPAVHFAAPAVRPLVDIAVENAVEGCVRETWAALVAAHQARAAADPAVRSAYAEIAGDEARHAELAWALDAWLAARLDEQERARVCVARSRAVAELRAELREDAPDALTRTHLGLPGPDVAARLCAGLNRALWESAA